MSATTLSANTLTTAHSQLYGFPHPTWQPTSLPNPFPWSLFFVIVTLLALFLLKMKNTFILLPISFFLFFSFFFFFLWHLSLWGCVGTDSYVQYSVETFLITWPCKLVYILSLCSLSSFPSVVILLLKLRYVYIDCSTLSYRANYLYIALFAIV